MMPLETDEEQITGGPKSPIPYRFWRANVGCQPANATSSVFKKMNGGRMENRLDRVRVYGQEALRNSSGEK